MTHIGLDKTIQSKWRNLHFKCTPPSLLFKDFDSCIDVYQGENRFELPTLATQPPCFLSIVLKLSEVFLCVWTTPKDLKLGSASLLTTQPGLIPLPFSVYPLIYCPPSSPSPASDNSWLGSFGSPLSLHNYIWHIYSRHRAARMPFSFFRHKSIAFIA